MSPNRKQRPPGGGVIVDSYTYYPTRIQMLVLQISLAISLMSTPFTFTEAFSPIPSSIIRLPPSSYIHTNAVTLSKLYRHYRTRTRTRTTTLYYDSMDHEEEEDDDDDDDDANKEDWRDFRAKLVMQFQKDDTTTNQNINDDTIQNNEHEPKNEPRPRPPPKKTSSWAYDSGSNIEKGSIILSKPEQDFSYGLQQQYFHKAVILVLHHDDTSYTKGIILNRPSNLILGDDDFENEDGTPLEGGIDEENEWKVWFGGDVDGLYSEEAEVICLHSLEDVEEARDVSERVMKGILWTSLSGAKELVTAGLATPSDFWTFVGSCGWDPGQLDDELQRNAWHVVAVDSQTVLDELRKNDDRTTDPQDAGLGTWSMLMKMIGKMGGEDGEEEENHITSGELINSDDQFDDLMLREWAKERLLFQNNDNGDVDDDVVMKNGDSSKEQKIDPLDDLLQKASMIDSMPMEIGVGSIVIDSSSKFTPFLLSDQEFHKSIVLIIQDDENASVGVILNLPTTTDVSMNLAYNNDDLLSMIEDKNDYDDTAVIPERYGGRFNTMDEDEKQAMVWLHYNQKLRDSGVGAPLGLETNKIWACSTDDVVAAVNENKATIQDFLVVSGCSIWEKSPGGDAGGIRGEVWNGVFEVFNPDENRMEEMWDLLLKQKVLSQDNIDENLELGTSAWSTALNGNKERDSKADDNEKTFVFNSSVTIAELQNKALRCWIATYLLDEPKIRNV